MRPVPRVAPFLVAVTAAACLAKEAAAVEILLQNDGFSSGQPVAFQAGFVAGEMAASRLVPPGTGGPWHLNRVQLLFGGASGDRVITLKIYDDAAGTTNPGLELFSQDYLLSGSSLDMQEIDLVPEGLTVNGQFRVAIQFQQGGLPCVASDQDGNIQPHRNFILAEGFGWAESSLFGLTGDWIIRAGVESALTDVGEQRTSALALAAAGANPSRGDRVALNLTLPSSDAARLELFDVAGRSVASQDVGALGAGRHTVELSPAGRLGSGVYVVRLTQGSARRAVRLVVTR